MTASLELSRFQGGQRWLKGGLIVGLVGAAGTVVGALLDPRRTAFSYLFAYAYAVSIAVAALILLAIWHATGAVWAVVVRRPLEALAGTVPLWLVLFLPIALWLPDLYVWVDPARAPLALTPHTLHLLEHKRPYLNVPFFLVRSALYFGVWMAVAFLFTSWSRRQDATGAVELTVWSRRLGAGALPALAVTLSFAAVDWLMSLDPAWFSTLFGVYFFAGGFVSAIAVLILAATCSTSSASFGPYVSSHHFHNLGKFLLAFVSFWAYIAFSQYLIIWIANLPEETPWFLVRTHTGWRPWALALVFGHFVFPFLLLLSQRLKLQGRSLSKVAAWVLVVHALDVYWLILPVYRAEGPHLSFTDLTSLMAVCGLGVALGVHRLRGGYALPVRDPFLADSLRYTQP